MLRLALLISALHGMPMLRQRSKKDPATAEHPSLARMAFTFRKTLWKSWKMTFKLFMGLGVREFLE